MVPCGHSSAEVSITQPGFALMSVPIFSCGPAAPAVQSKLWMCQAMPHFKRQKNCISKCHSLLLCLIFMWMWLLSYLWKYVSFVISYVACPSLIDVVVVCDESNSIYPWDAVKNFGKICTRPRYRAPQRHRYGHSLYRLNPQLSSEKILLEMKSSSLHLSNPILKAFNGNLES